MEIFICDNVENGIQKLLYSADKQFHCRLLAEERFNCIQDQPLLNVDPRT